MDGKEKCRALRQVRDEIAQRNGIALNREECTYDGPCEGTCPKCEGELKALTDALDARQAEGQPVEVPEVSWDGLFADFQPGDDTSDPPDQELIRPDTDDANQVLGEVTAFEGDPFSIDIGPWN